MVWYGVREWCFWRMGESHTVGLRAENVWLAGIGVVPIQELNLQIIGRDTTRDQEPTKKRQRASRGDTHGI